MKRFILLTLLLLFGFSAVQAQSQATQFVNELRVGTEQNGSYHVTEIFYFSRGASQSIIDAVFFTMQGNDLAVKVKRSDGFNFHGREINGLTDSFSANNNRTFILSKEGQVISGRISFSTTATWYPSLNRTLVDVETQLVFKHYNTNGTLISAASAAASDGFTQLKGKTFIMQGFVNSGAGDIKIKIFNPENSGKAKVNIMLYDAFVASGINNKTIKVKHGKTVEKILKDIFPGNLVIDGHLEITSNKDIIITAYRIENGVEFEIPVFIGKQLSF